MGAFDDFEVTVKDRGLRRLLQRFPKEVPELLRLALNRAAIFFNKMFKRRRLRGRPGLNKRTSALVRSFVAKITPRGGRITGMKGMVESSSKYGPIQEFGGVIKAKGGALAVPISPEYGGEALTPAGVLKSKYVGPLRRVPNLVMIPREGRPPILFEKRGKKGGLVPLFVLKKSVRIKRRLGFFATFKRWYRKPASEWRVYLNNAIAKAWRLAGAK
jgi:hypothetical protein